MGTARKQITVTVLVPEGDCCESNNAYCDFWYRDHNSPRKECYCILFNMVKLDQKHKENMVAGLDVLKCDQCRKLCEEAG